MPQTLDIARILARGAPLGGAGRFDFSRRDFPGYTVRGPVQAAWQARPLGSAVDVALQVRCAVEGQCVRCLEECSRPLETDARYTITPQELAGEYSEYPAAQNGVLDMDEMAYGEILLNAPLVLLCREDCPGLCGVCGKPKETCACAGG